MSGALSPLERRLRGQLDQFRADAIYKTFNYLESPQAPRARMEGRGSVIILSSNNYLGLCDDPVVMAAAKGAIDEFGAGTASVRFICGTFTIHRALEAACARLVGAEASVSFVSCWNANEALPATVLTDKDIILSDQLNHASIIDGLRLAKSITKCETGVFRHGDYAELDQKLAAAADKEVKIVVSDGIFSMEGSIVNLPALMEVCRKHGALVWLDDSHATGVLGARGRGTAEHFGCTARSTSSRPPSARRWGVPQEGLWPVPRHSAITSCNAPVPSSLPTPCHPRWPHRHWQPSRFWRARRSACPPSGKTPRISGRVCWLSGFDPLRAILQSCP